MGVGTTDRRLEAFGREDEMHVFLGAGELPAGVREHALQLDES
jgi:hypothetical protein